MIKHNLPKTIMSKESMTHFLRIHYNLYNISFNTVCKIIVLAKNHFIICYYHNIVLLLARNKF